AGIRRWRNPFMFGTAAVVGWLLLDGGWRAHLWSAFGNPFFPLFNQWFASPLVAPESLGDTRFVPHGLWPGLAYPFYWTIHARAVSDVGRFRDLRIPLLFATAIAWLFLRMRRRESRLPRGGAFLLVGCAIAYVAWLGIFGVYRYLATLELLAPLAIVLLLHDLGVSVRRAGIVAVFILMGILVTPLRYGRGDWISADYFDLQVPETILATRTGTVLIGGLAPTAFLLPSLPSGLRFVRISSEFHGRDRPQGIDHLIEAAVRAADSDLYALVDPAEMNAFDTQLSRLHLRGISPD